MPLYFSEDFDDYERDPITWQTQMRSSLQRTSSLGRNCRASGAMSDLCYLSNYQRNTYCADKSARESKFKVITIING